MAYVPILAIGRRALEQKYVLRRALSTYEAMVALAVADGTVSIEESRACAKFRETHGIDIEQHKEAVRKAGWKGAFPDGSQI